MEVLELLFSKSKIDENEDNNIKGYHYHFLEYRFTISELKKFLKQTNFSIIDSIPHDLFGSNQYAIGLTIDFPFLKKKTGEKFKLNRIGQILNRIFSYISPWISTASILCVAKVIK